MWKLRELTDKVTNVVMNYSEVEAKVREATNDDQWGPHGTLMAEIAKETFTYEHFPEVMGMLWKRMLTEPRKNWRRTYKCLLLLKYLILNGSERVVTSAREHIYDLKGLEDFSARDEFGKDQGINVRQKVKEVVDFIQDDDRLRDERRKARKTKDKYIGMSGDQYQYKYSDRYDPQSRKDKLKEWEDEINSHNRRQRHSRRRDSSDDSPPDYVSDDDVEEADSYQYKDKEDSVTSSEFSTSSKTESQTKKTSKLKSGKKVDLGAAASYGASEKTSSSKQEVPSQPSQDIFSLIDTDVPAQPTLLSQTQSSTDAFADFSSPEAVTSLDSSVDTAGANTSQTTANGEFGDFSVFQGSTTSPKSPEKGDSSFGDFQATAFVAPPTSTNSSNSSLLMGMTVQSPVPQEQVLQPQQQQQPPLQQQQPQLQQQQQPMQPQVGMQQTPLMPMSSVQSNQQIPQQPMAAGSSATSQMPPMQNTQPMMGQQPMQPTPGGLGNPGMGPMAPMVGSVPMANPQMMPQQMPGMMAAQQQPMMAPQPNMMTPSKTTSSATQSPQKNTIWTNSKVDISLDSLSPADKYKKTIQPSMNELQQHNSPQMGGMQGNFSAQPSGANMYNQAGVAGMTSGMGQMNLGAMNQQTPMMNMQPMQNSMGMGMGMQGMGMGIGFTGQHGDGLHAPGHHGNANDGHGDGQSITNDGQ
ncbi:clathrin interactor 1-like isoform X2 [Ptychodera flava]|uniref:clathrin interactor 1-like isoform X2 n=1 Tax=Ptychodera flava TaxID=63121 RepID=UPI00396A8EE9